MRLLFSAETCLADGFPCPPGATFSPRSGALQGSFSGAADHLSYSPSRCSVQQQSKRRDCPVARQFKAGLTPAAGRHKASAPDDLNRCCSRRLESLLPSGNERAVVKALAIGDKQELDRVTKKNYRASGASHLLALSGLHVGILYKLLVALFFPLGGNPQIRRIVRLAVLGFLWFYALLSGMSASISRAVLMITIYEGAAFANRPRDGWNALAISAMVITLFNPEAPREIGFQLSFAACLGIFGLYPRLKGLLRTRIKPLTSVWNGAALAISCQGATCIPVWLYFRSFPKYFLITNLLTLPLVTATLYLTAFTLVISVMGVSTKLPAALLQGVVELMNRVISQIAELP